MQVPQAPQGLVVNSKLITAIVGAITIFASLFTVMDKVNSYEYRLNAVEINDQQRSNDVKTLIGELKFLNTKLTDLTIELREMRAANNARAQK